MQESSKENIIFVCATKLTKRNKQLKLLCVHLKFTFNDLYFHRMLVILYLSLPC